MTREEFARWFKNPIESLQKNIDCGIILMMISFPLIERYLRTKSGLKYQSKYTKSFYEEFHLIFNEISVNESKLFWIAYRHGLLHQATMNNSQITCSLSRSVEKIIYYEDKNLFLVNPFIFSKKVIDTIYDSANFDKFLAIERIKYPLITEHLLDFGNGTCFDSTSAEGIFNLEDFLKSQ
jgi:hypothetical protein